eukprot:Skav219336  [mRNA]  locus=scaffold4190:4114:19716:- [translate_table: standard]
MLSYFAGLDFISHLDVNQQQLQSMAVSISISCCSLGLGFASRDKKDTKILGLPGKIDWGPVMVALVAVRTSEVFSRLAAFNIIQVSWRSNVVVFGHLGGPAAAAAMCAATAFCFENLLRVLGRCPALEELNFDGCRFIPGTAWAKLQGAQWRQMRKANFSLCFARQGDGAEDLLQALGSCSTLEELNFDDCPEIPGAAWAQLRGAEWPQMRKAWLFQWTQTATNFPGVAGVDIACDNKRAHLPWGKTRDDAGKVIFAAAEEAQYPRKMCAALVQCIPRQF